ncbi:MAG: ISL3 family transposase [Erysipelotrichales bacterium]|nr:ISL3 family transposase [Erysipelotrichales bacterium]
MSLEKFITDILNIKLETLEKIDSLVTSDDSILIKIRLVPTKNPSCPLCKNSVKIHGYYPRKLIHSTLANRKCTIIYNQRRYKCDSCDFTFHEINPFANPKENVTYETKINVLKDLKYVDSTYTAVARRHNLSVTKVQRIFDTHVNIPRKSLPEALSIDEHYFPESNYDSLYCCLLMDFSTGTLLDILPDRKKDYLSNYLNSIRNATLDYSTGCSELNNVKFVSIDLYDNYRDISKTYFPNAIICADSFHVIKHLTEGFNQVRLRCRRSTEDENLQYLLTKFKFIFNHNVNLDNQGKYNKRFKRYLNYRDMQELLFYNFPDLKQAYLLKETYIRFNETSSIQSAKDELSSIISMFADSNIKEYDEFYNLLINWFTEICNSFSMVQNRRINNSYIESRNRQLERLLYNANGFTNFKRTRNRILYCLNKNDTYSI